MKEKKIKINYIILTIILIVIASSCVYCVKLYKMHKESDLSVAILNEYLNEIKLNELNDFLTENPDAFIYTCFSDEQACREFELEFKEVIIKYNLRDHVVYLNLKDIRDEYKENYKEKVKEYINNLNVNDLPVILKYTEKELIEIKKISTPADVLKFLDTYEVNYLND